eukprot:12431853-Alexandrium_andersonii.AAC.1
MALWCVCTVFGGVLPSTGGSLVLGLPVGDVLVRRRVGLPSGLCAFPWVHAGVRLAFLGLLR